MVDSLDIAIAAQNMRYIKDHCNATGCEYKTCPASTGISNSMIAYIEYPSGGRLEVFGLTESEALSNLVRAIAREKIEAEETLPQA